MTWAGSSAKRLDEPAGVIRWRGRYGTPPVRMGSAPRSRREGKTFPTMAKMKKEGGCKRNGRKRGMPAQFNQSNIDESSSKTKYSEMPTYTRLTEDKDIEWFLDTVIIRDIGEVIEAGAGYLAFGLIAEAIEVLGALLDEHDFEEPDQSEKRFVKAIDMSFKPINNRYAQLNRSDSDYFLYKHLRCGMAHILRPSARLVFTGQDDAKRFGAKHLEEVMFEDGAAHVLLVIEDFYADLIEACRRTKNHLKNKTHAKLKKGYITISKVAAPSSFTGYTSGAPILSGAGGYANITGVAPGAGA